MSDVYAIKTTTLTALGDAVRNKTGKLTREEEVPVAVSYDVSLVNIETSYNSFSENFEQTGMTAVKVKVVDFDGSACDIENVQFRYNRSSIQTDPDYELIEFTFDENNEAFIENLPNQYVVFWFRIFPSVYPSMSCSFKLEVTPYDADGNSLSVTETVTVTNTMTPLEMVEEINNLLPGPTAEDLVFTGMCQYKFSRMDWLINKYGNLITTKDITDGNYLFSSCETIEKIPFDINFKHPGNGAYAYTNCISLFDSCKNLTIAPKITGLRPYNPQYMFTDCHKLVEVPLESVEGIDWTYIDNATSAYSCNRSHTFANCYNLRSFPAEFLNHGNPVGNYSTWIYYNLFKQCYALDEIINLPVVHQNANSTSNGFYDTFHNCGRLKNITFALQEDGSPYVCSGWKNQTIDLSGYVGYTYTKATIETYITTITVDKEVNSDETYQALKDDPDWFATKEEYCRYNHDSAVATINSLPDVSASGGTNTIKFKGAAGSATDGGAINTLTEEEIAVATAKGWTVTLV